MGAVAEMAEVDLAQPRVVAQQRFLVVGLDLAVAGQSREVVVDLPPQAVRQLGPDSRWRK